MNEKATHGEVLDVLMLYWLSHVGAHFGEMVPTDLGAPLDAALAARRVILANLPSGRPSAEDKRIALISAIAAEEAADRLETARAALLDAATEFVSVAGDPFVPDVFGPAQAEAYEALYYAQNEWQEAQLHAYRPEEAAGLVEVTDG